jgi:hypothetical protein
MQMPLYLAQGHHELAEPVVDCEVDHSPGHPANVVLLASISDGQGGSILAPSRGRTGTTLAFRMDHQAAMILHARLTELGRSMGWLPATKA